MKRLIVFLSMVLSIATLVSTTSCAETQEEIPQPEPIEPAESSFPPEFFLNSDGDGYNNWFETNIAHYNPNTPNDRYIIVFMCLGKDIHQDILKCMEWQKEEILNFWLEKAKVPAENITMLIQEEATRPNLQKAIEEIALKATENDIVFLDIDAHGAPNCITGYPYLDSSSGSVEKLISYTAIDQWLDEINAKVVIVDIMACHWEVALPKLKDGSCPRIVFALPHIQFIEALAEKINERQSFIIVDTEYGNGDGYVSMKEIGNWMDNDARWSPEYGELGDKARGYYEIKGESRWTDTSGIADQIYLTDYTP